MLLNGLLMLGVAAFGTVTMSSSTGGFLDVLHFLPLLIALIALRRDRSQPKPAFSTPWPRVLVPLALACSPGLLGGQRCHRCHDRFDLAADRSRPLRQPAAPTPDEGQDGSGTAGCGRRSAGPDDVPLPRQSHTTGRLGHAEARCPLRGLISFYSTSC